MPLDVVEIRDLREFFRDYLSAVIERDLPGNSLASNTNFGWLPSNRDGRAAGGAVWSVYNQVRDEVIYVSSFKQTPSSTVALREAIYSRDALCRNPAVGSVRLSAVPTAGAARGCRRRRGRSSPRIVLPDGP